MPVPLSTFDRVSAAETSLSSRCFTKNKCYKTFPGCLDVGIGESLGGDFLYSSLLLVIPKQGPENFPEHDFHLPLFYVRSMNRFPAKSSEERMFSVVKEGHQFWKDQLGLRVKRCVESDLNCILLESIEKKKKKKKDSNRNSKKKKKKKQKIRGEEEDEEEEEEEEGHSEGEGKSHRFSSIERANEEDSIEFGSKKLFSVKLLLIQDISQVNRKKKFEEKNSMRTVAGRPFGVIRSKDLSSHLLESLAVAIDDLQGRFRDQLGARRDDEQRLICESISTSLSDIICSSSDAEFQSKAIDMLVDTIQKLGRDQGDEEPPSSSLAAATSSSSSSSSSSLEATAAAAGGMGEGSPEKCMNDTERTSLVASNSSSFLAFQATRNRESESSGLEYNNCDDDDNNNNNTEQVIMVEPSLVSEIIDNLVQKSVENFEKKL